MNENVPRQALKADARLTAYFADEGEWRAARRRNSLRRAGCAGITCAAVNGAVTLGVFREYTGCKP